MTRTVAIIGCGLGGATLAIALLRRGFKVRIYEQAARLQELGAGLTVSGVCMRVFDAIGIWERVRDITTVQGGFTYVHYQTGELLTGNPDPDWTHKPSRVGEAGHTHRALMHGLLVQVIQELDPEALKVHHRLESFEQDDTGVRFSFTNGEQGQADVLIGCDGLHSVTHRLLFGEAAPTFTGVIAMRATVPIDDRIWPFLSGGRASNFVGPDRGFLRYGIKDATLLNVVGLAKTDRFEAEGWDNRSSRDELMSFYGDFHPDVIGIIQNAPADGFFKWALFDREPIKRWTQDRVTLLGDAAHPMLPYLGQGAGQAIEDAMVLARALEKYEDAGIALAAYEAARIERASWIVHASREQSAALNQPDPYNYSNVAIEAVRLQDYNPVTAPL